MAEHAQQAHSLRVARLFTRLKQEGVRCCVWKSADRWEDGLAGKTDIDLLVAESDLARTCSAMIAEGWTPVRAESWRSFERVLDFITVEDGRCLHLHLHGRIVSGEKMVKSFRPPLTEFYLSHLRREPYPPFIEPELELVVFLCRAVLKISWRDLAGAVKRGSRRAVFRQYVGEYDRLKPQCDRDHFKALILAEPLSRLPAHVMLDAFDDIATLGWRERHLLRRALADWREPRFVMLRSACRWAQRRIQGVGKTLPFRGISVAICGPDGSGKTTTSLRVQKALSRHIKTRHFYMGGNSKQPGRVRAVVIRCIWPAYLIVRKVLKIARYEAGVGFIESQYARLNQNLMRREKLRRLALAERALNSGQIVVFERYPLFFPNGDDTQRSVHAGRSRPSRPDILVYLEVDYDTLLQRRWDDQPEVLKRKLESFRSSRMEPVEGCKVMVLRGDAPMEANVSQVLSQIDALLAARARQHGMLRMAQ